MKDPQNKKKWIIDTESAEVVKSIFAMCIEGKGNETIARILQENKVMIIVHLNKETIWKQLKELVRCNMKEKLAFFYAHYKILDLSFQRQGLNLCF